MGATEETAKAASGFMEAMKGQPLSLALVVMNICLMGLMWKVYTKADETRQAQMKMIFEAQREVQQLLVKCVIPPEGK
jgi:hypothetical protein